MISSMIWGVALILLGLSLIIKTIFGISIPFLRILIGILFLYAGISLITGLDSYSNKQVRTIIFKKDELQVQYPYRSYNILFANGIIDLSLLQLTQATTIDINVLFGLGVIRVSSKIPTAIYAESFVGGLQLPDETIINWGKKRYFIGADKHSALLHLNAKAVFGNLIIELV